MRPRPGFKLRITVGFNRRVVDVSRAEYPDNGVRRYGKLYNIQQFKFWDNPGND